VIVCAAAAPGVTLTEHRPVPSRVQLVGLKVAVPLALQLTVPPGTPGVPAALLSFTLAVQVVGTPAVVELGSHTTLVVVVRWTVRL
jgi:hypothetical protein